MSVALLRKLGVYIDPDFLSADFCAEICAEMDGGQKTSTPVFSEDVQSNHIDVELRNSVYANVSDKTKREVGQKIEALQPALEQHFGERFHPDIYEKPKFAQYNEGHYFAAHRDSQLHRRINISIYLNDEKSGTAEDGYSGGKLVLYELFPKLEFAKKGISLVGKQGMLIAYPAEIAHEVTPVVEGTRYAIIARFLDQNAG